MLDTTDRIEDNTDLTDLFGESYVFEQKTKRAGSKSIIISIT